MNYFYFLLFFFTSSLIAERNPFVFSNESKKVAKPDLGSSQPQQVASSEWRIIASDGNKIIVQHTDGTIRTISAIDE